MWFFGQQCLLKPSIYVLDPNLQLLYSMNICGSTSNTTASILCRKISVFSWLQWVADYQFPEVRSWDASLSPVPSEVSHHQFDFVPCLGMWFQPTIKLKWFVTVVITARGVIHLCHHLSAEFPKNQTCTGKQTGWSRYMCTVIRSVFQDEDPSPFQGQISTFSFSWT